jgi:hypothetical protein
MNANEREFEGKGGRTEGWKDGGAEYQDDA